MALILVTCDKGSPGATTTALALAAAWPRPVMLAETDPSGGDLVYRLRAAGALLDSRAALSSLATAVADSAPSPDVIAAHTQRADGGLPVLLGPPNQDQAAILAPLWPVLGPALARHTDTRGQTLDVIADCGRLTHDSPALALLPYAARTVMVTRTSTESLAHLRDRAAHLAAWRAAARMPPSPPAVVIIGERKDASRTATALRHVFAHAGLSVQIAGTLPLDPLAVRVPPVVNRGRSDFERAARDLAAHLLPSSRAPRAELTGRPR